MRYFFLTAAAIITGSSILTSRATIALAYSLAIPCVSAFAAEQCSLDHKVISFQYSPDLCARSDCVTTQKLLILGNEIEAYFGPDVNPIFKSANGNVSNAENVAYGFIYSMNAVSDVLSDSNQTGGLSHATASLSPGSRYLSYKIGSSWDGDTLKLEDHAELDIKWIGHMTTEVSTDIRIHECNLCEARILLTTIVRSRNTMELGTSKCQISLMQ
jgi:hypothetical protein